MDWIKVQLSNYLNGSKDLLENLINIWKFNKFPSFHGTITSLPYSPQSDTELFPRHISIHLVYTSKTFCGDNFPYHSPIHSRDLQSDILPSGFPITFRFHFLPPHSFYITSPSHPTWFHNLNGSFWRIQIMKLLTYVVLIFSTLLSSLGRLINI